MRRRFAPGLLPAALFFSISAGAAHAQTTNAVASANPAVAPIAAPVAAAVRSPWDISTTLRVSAGWRDNVTVSAFHPVDRAFWRGEAEVFVLRPLGSRWQLISLLSGDVLRYVSPPAGVAGEEQWVAHLETRWQPVSVFRTALKADGFQETTYIDPSQTEGAQEPPLRVRIRGGYSTLIPRLTLPWGFTFEPSVQAKRITYRTYNGHYREIRPGARLEWKHSRRLVLSAEWFEHTRHYSELTETTAQNRPLRGWLLSLRQREADAKASTEFEAGGTWTVTATAARLENRDPAHGYLDYNQRRAQLEVAWERGPWHTSASGDARRIDYLVQRVGIGNALQRPARITDAYEVVGRIERDLSPRWVAFTEARWERNRSNVADDAQAHPFNYRTSTTLVGIQRTF